MAVKKPKTAKPSFSINDILKFIESQAVGDKAKGMWQEAADIPMPNMAGGNKSVAGINPLTSAVMGKIGKGAEGLANTGIGQWFGTDAAFNIGKPKQGAGDATSSLAGLMFALSPFTGGRALKKIKGAAKGGSIAAKGAATGVSDFASIIKMLMGMQDK
jgi:hypothetical protein